MSSGNTELEYWEQWELTEEYLQTDQAADETVEVDGVASVGVASDDLLDHSAVQLEP